MDYIIFCYLFFEIKKNRNRFFIYAIIYIWTKDLSSFKNPPLLKEDQESLQELNLDKDEDTLFTASMTHNIDPRFLFIDLLDICRRDNLFFGVQ